MTDPKQVPLAIYGTTDWHGWATTLKRASIMGMPNTVGLNPNYQGDAYASFSDPSNPMVTDHTIYFLCTIGLNDPDTALADAVTGAMDQKWGDAAGKIRGAEGYGDPWTFPPLVEVRPSCIARIGHEMTIPNQYAWCDDGSPNWRENFSAAFVRCLGVLRQIMPNGGSVGACLNPNWDFWTAHQYDLATMINEIIYAGGAYDPNRVNDLGLDVYFYPQYQDPDSTVAWNDHVVPNLNKAVELCQQFNLTLSIPEFGSTDPSWYGLLAAWIAACPVEVAFVGIWSSNSGYPSDLDDPTHADLRAAFIAAFGP